MGSSTEKGTSESPNEKMSVNAKSPVFKENEKKARANDSRLCLQGASASGSYLCSIHSAYFY